MTTPARPVDWKDRAWVIAARHPRILRAASGLLLGTTVAAALLVVAPDATQNRWLALDASPHDTTSPTTASGNALPIDRQHPSFAEEFDRLRLQDQGGPWRTSFDYDGIAAYTLRPNGEKQLYVDRRFRGSADAPLGLDPFTLSDGMVTITASPVSDALSRKMWGYGYASGLLSTKGSFAQRYGYFEIRARLTDQPSLWPAFWLLPADGSWPPEIDVLEQLGREPAKIYMSTVTKGTSGRVPGRGVAEG